MELNLPQDELTAEHQQLLIDIARALQNETVDTHDLRNALNPECSSIWWCVDDMRWVAKDFEDRNDAKRGTYYDYDKIPGIFRYMMYKHDCTNGITWETIDIYLNQYCVKDKE